MLGQCLRHGIRKAVAVDGQRAARRNLVGIGAGHDQRVHAPHLAMDQADGIGCRLVRPEGIGTDEFGQLVGLVGIGAAHGAHLVQDDGNADAGDLPGGFGPGEAAADNVDGCNV